MKIEKKFLLYLIVAASLILAGCQKNSVTDPIQNDDAAAVERQVSSIDSIAAFLDSDARTIDDVTMLSMNVGGSGMMKVASPINPVKWGRHVFWNLVTKTVASEPEGDSVMVVTITRTVPAELRIGARFPGSTIGIDTVIKKQFTEVLVRKVRFVRVARHKNADSNWVANALSMAVGRTTPDSANTFSITSLEIAGSVDTTITDPLSMWFRYGRGFRRIIPRFSIGDSVTVRVTISSRNDSNEVVVLRHGVRGEFDERRRLRMNLVSLTGEPGNYTKVFEKTFVVLTNLSTRPFSEPIRYNAIVDAWSHDSLFDDGALVGNEFWGVPYFVQR